MAKATPEETAAKVAARLQQLREDTAVGLANSELGQQVLLMLSKADTVSRGELLAHFEAVANDAGLAEVERALAGEVIRRLERRS